MLGVIPPAMRFIPIGALAVKALYESRLGKDTPLLSKPEDSVDPLPAPTDNQGEPVAKKTTTTSSEIDHDECTNKP